MGKWLNRWGPIVPHVQPTGIGQTYSLGVKKPNDMSSVPSGTGVAISYFLPGLQIGTQVEVLLVAEHYKM